MENIQETPQITPTFQPTPSQSLYPSLHLLENPTLILCAILILGAVIAILFFKSQQKSIRLVYQPASQSALNSLAPTLAPVADAKRNRYLENIC